MRFRAAIHRSRNWRAVSNGRRSDSRSWIPITQTGALPRRRPIADFGVHAALVVGTPWHVDSEDPRHIATSLQTLKVTLRGGNDFVAEGEGRNALGSPLLALGFLPRVLAAQSWAPPLMAGEVIATGTLTALPYLRRGESYRVERRRGRRSRRLQLDLEAPSA